MLVCLAYFQSCCIVLLLSLCHCFHVTADPGQPSILTAMAKAQSSSSQEEISEAITDLEILAANPSKIKKVNEKASKKSTAKRAKPMQLASDSDLDIESVASSLFARSQRSGKMS